MTKVVIIGAGASGLFAAYNLVTRGVLSGEDIVILEAENRVGGRIYTIPFNGHWLELGAQWIHGRGQNPLWKFVEENEVSYVTFWADIGIIYRIF
jgi:protoporphyrinogen oxidase